MGKSKYTARRLEKIEIALLKTGSDKEAMLQAGITKTTYYRWIDEIREFRELRERTLQRFVELQVKRNPELEQRAVNVLEKALEPLELKTSKEESEILIDRETGEQLRVLKVKRTTTRREVQPDLNAAMKVLGPGPLETVLFRIAIRRALEDPESDLYTTLFGPHGTFAETKKWGEDVVADVLHMERLAELQEQARQQYQDGGMAFEQYHQLTVEQAKVFSQIKSQYEDRAGKAIGAKSYSETLAQVQRFINVLFDTLREVINDVAINREDIPRELSKRVRERAGVSGIRQVVAGDGRGD